MKRTLVSLLVIALIINTAVVPNRYIFAGGQDELPIKKGILTGEKTVDGVTYQTMYFQVKYKETTNPSKAYRNKGYFLSLDVTYDKGTKYENHKVYNGFVKTNSSINDGVVTVEYPIYQILDAVGAPDEAYFCEGKLTVNAGMVLIEDGRELDTNFDTFSNDKLGDYSYTNTHLFKSEYAIKKAPQDRWGVSWSLGTQRNLQYSFDQTLELEKLIDVDQDITLELNDTSTNYIMSENEMFVDVHYTMTSQLDIAKQVPFTKYFVTSNGSNEHYPGELSSIKDGATITKSYTKKFLRSSLNEGINHITLEGTSTASFKVIRKITDLIEKETMDITIDVKPTEPPELTLRGVPDPEKIKYEGASLSTEITVEAKALDSKIVNKWLLKCDDREDEVIRAISEYAHTFTIDIPKDQIESNLTGSEWILKVPIYAKASDTNGETSEAAGEVEVIIYKDAEPVIPNRKPDITISMPSYAIEGEDFRVRVEGSDPEDEPITFHMTTPSPFSKDIEGGSNTVYSNSHGRFTVSGYTKDASGNKSKVASKEIYILEAKPMAIQKLFGNGHTNYDQKYDGSKSVANSTRYPIVSYEWSFKAVSGMSDEDIHIKDNNLDGITAHAQYDKPGVVEVSLTVTNSKGREHTSKVLYTIDKDLGLVPNLYSPEKVYRDIDNERKATITMIDKTTSQDMDHIDLRFFFITKNSDNDSNMNEETVLIYDQVHGWISTGKTFSEMKTNPYTALDLLGEYNGISDSSVEFEAEGVGHYRCDVISFEGYHERIPEFTTLDKIAKSNTFNHDDLENKTMVDNFAPLTSLSISAKEKKEVDIVIMTDYVGEKKQELQVYMTELRAKMYQNGESANFHWLDDIEKLGEQHGTKDYKFYSRRITVNYKVTGTHTDDGTFKNDPRRGYVNYETKWDYSMPSTSEFEKGNEINCIQTSYSNEGSSSKETGKKLLFFNPNNQAGTMASINLKEYRHSQGMNFAYIERYTLSDINWSGGHSWVYTGSKQVHDFQHDIPGVSLNAFNDIDFKENSDKIFLVFAEGSSPDYRVDDPMNAKNFKFGNLTKDFVSKLVSMNFETYVVAEKEALDIKFDDANKYDSDLLTQDATLRNLAKSSAVRGKILQNWKNDLRVLYEPDVARVDNVEVKNNIVEIKLSKPVGEYAEVKMDIIRELLDTTDALGNVSAVEEDLIVENITGHGRLKDLDGGLAFTESPPIYDNEEVVSVRTTENFISTLKKDGTVSTYNMVGRSSSLYVDTSTWTDIKQIEATDEFIVGVKNNGVVVYSGKDRSTARRHPQIAFDQSKMNLTNVREIIPAGNGMFLHHNDDTLSLLNSFMSYYDNDTRYLVRDHLTNEKNQGKKYDNISGTDKGLITIRKLPEINIAIYGRPYGPSVYSATNYDPAHFYWGQANIYFKSHNGLWYRCYNSNIDGSNRVPTRVNEFNTSSEYLYETRNELIGHDPINKVFIVKDMVEERSEYSDQLRGLTDIAKILEVKEDSIAYSTSNNEIKFVGNMVNIHQSAYQQFKRESEKKLLDNGMMQDGNFIPTMKVIKNITGIQGDVKQVLPLEYGCHVVLYENGRTQFIRNNDSYNESAINNIASRYQAAGNYTDIKKMAFIRNVIYMLRENGTLATIGNNHDGDYNLYESAQSMRDIKTFDSDSRTMVTINKEGVFNRYGYSYSNYYSDSEGMQALYNDKDFVDIKWASGGAIGIKKDGTLVSSSLDINVEGITDVKDVVGDNYVKLYLRKDGTIGSFGSMPVELMPILDLKNVKSISMVDYFVYALTEDNMVYQYHTRYSYPLPKSIPFNLIDNEKIDYQAQKTQIHLGSTTEEDHSFKYKIFNKTEDSVYIPTLEETLNETWHVIHDKDTITCDDDVYIGVAEVDRENKVVGYSFSRSRASRNK